MYNQRKC